MRLHPVSVKMNRREARLASAWADQLGLSRSAAIRMLVVRELAAVGFPPSGGLHLGPAPGFPVPQEEQVDAP